MSAICEPATENRIPVRVQGRSDDIERCMVSSFALLSILVTIGALFSLISVGHQAPALHTLAERLVAEIDFNKVVLHGMLAFLLFAGALQLDLKQLASERVSVLVLSIVTTALSTVFVAWMFYAALRLVHVPMSVSGALLFGALISPTDPIAVLDMLRRAGAPRTLEIQLAGESLFNDGVGAVIFLALLGASAGGGYPSAGVFGSLLLLKAGGGVAVGVALGYITYRLLCLVNSYRVEVMLTLALAMGGYALADALEISAPLEVVAAGLLVSGRAQAMSAETQEHVERFWELTDDFLNVVLFLLLGLQILVLPFTKTYLIAGLMAVPLVLIARFASVGICVRILSLFRAHVRGSVLVLTWGGLRGGLAVALALSLPKAASYEHDLLLIATFIVVVFSILVQGLSLPLMIRRMGHLKRES